MRYAYMLAALWCYPITDAAYAHQFIMYLLFPFNRIASATEAFGESSVFQ